MASPEPDVKTSMSMAVDVTCALFRRHDNGFMHPVDEKLLAQSARGLRAAADLIASRGNHAPLADAGLGETTETLHLVFRSGSNTDLVETLRVHAVLLDRADDDTRVLEALAAFRALTNQMSPGLTASAF